MKKTPLWLVVAAAALGCGDEGGFVSNSDTEGAKTTTQSIVGPAACSIDAPRELLITDLAVTTSAWARLGPWSFGHLVTEMAPSGQDPSDFVLEWLKEWASMSSVNGFPVSSASSLVDTVLCPWAKASGTPCTGPNPIRLDFAKAPFQLIAIVNRVDLRSGATNAGEGRFVFNVLDESRRPLQATVIFEYGVPAGTSARTWAKRWHSLLSAPDASTFGPQYRDELRAITDEFTRRGAGGTKPNGSALNQVRTNELGFVPTWNLREFHLQARSGALLPATTAETPDFRTFNNAPRDLDLVTDLIANRAAVLAGTYHVPPQWLGGEALQLGKWDPKNLSTTDEPLRRAFASNTCDGCHLEETGARFTHLIFDNGQTVISDWLQNVDLPRRVLDMQGLICLETRQTLDAHTPSARVH